MRGVQITLQRKSLLKGAMERKKTILRYVEITLLVGLLGWSLACGGRGASDILVPSPIQDLGSFHGEAGRVGATAINSAGTVVGVDFTEITDSGSLAFRWTDDLGIELLNHPGESLGGSEVFINDAGTIAFINNEQGESQANSSVVLWRSDSDRQVIAEGAFSLNGLNNNGQLIGCDYTDVGQDPKCWLWSKLINSNSGEKSYLPTGWIPTGMDDQGDLIITHIKDGIAIGDSVVFSEGNAVSVPTLGGNFTSLLDLNEQGVAVGGSDTTILNSFGIHAIDIPLSHAVVFDAVKQELIDIDGRSDRGSIAHAVNNQGYVVGTMYSVTTEGGLSTSSVGQAFIYHPRFGIVAIAQLLPSLAGWELLQAVDINENLEVVGSGYLNGVERAFKVSLREYLPN